MHTHTHTTLPHTHSHTTPHTLSHTQRETHYLMDDDVCEGAVTDHDAGGEEGEAGVLHAPEGEGGGHDEQVVAAPLVRPKQTLPRRQKLFHLPLKLCPGGVLTSGKKTEERFQSNSESSESTKPTREPKHLQAFSLCFLFFIFLQSLPFPIA